MNYFHFHLGDYAAHTAHLTWEEDLIYRRLLDVYYLHERALAPDTKKLARVIRMPKSISVIEAVLDEFFTLQDDGWHNKRADVELVAMSEKQEVSEERTTHEKDRQKRYRERRAAMFEALRVVGIVPAWDVSMKDLQRLFDEHCNAPVTEPETDLKRYGDVSGNAPATAIPIPIPIPIPKEERDIGSAVAEPTTKTVTARMLTAEGVDKQSAEDWLTLRKAKRLPLTHTAWADTKAEGEKVGLCPAETVAHAVRSNWAGFKASWYARDNAAHSGESMFAGAI
jgi:uncharacterized protein YdaU (DUF1376 family)